MEKKDLMRKQELAEVLGMKFDEAAELFSEETLGTMRLLNTVGGNENDVGFFCFNSKEYCDNDCKKYCDSVCGDKNGQTKDKEHDCGVDITLAPPTVPPTPIPITLPEPTLPPYISPTIEIPDIR